MVTKLKKGDKVDLNCGYFTAPSDGRLIIDEDGWRFERMCQSCSEPCGTDWCYTKEEE